MTSLSDLDTSGLRERNVPIHTGTEDAARAAVIGLNAEEENGGKDEKDRKTFGRTPDGTVFTVPQTHDMVSQLLSPTEPKNLSDLFVLAVLALHIFALWALPATLKIPVFAAVYLFWRASYNVGIGYLLHMQSNHGTMILWAKKYKIFVNPETGKNPHPKLYKLLKRELETKIPQDYSFEQAPIEYNTWLVFRRVVDLILMCDFVSYCLFAIACGGRPEGETALFTALRWIAGWILVAFNLWVKLDAHRVVKDFAWYWGDFFYLIDQELTFDGVFEMAPHPMYSVGYAGYYGISLMAASYNVLFISILAHAAQFAFLVKVENPHIEKTYNAPPPRKRHMSTSESTTSREDLPVEPPVRQTSPNEEDLTSIHQLLGFKNIDIYRITDSSVLLVQVLLFALTVLTPNAPIHQAFFVINAAVWRLWYSVGIGYILDRQSNKKKWTRHFVKYGESSQEAWRQWKGMYHLSMTMCWASFIAAAWKMYTFPTDWSYGLAPLKLTLGLGLVALQIWTSVSIYDSLGEFGWFFGDFFFTQTPKLTYSGIYRFLNNPERVLGLAGVWGAVLITGSKAIFFLALLSHVLSLAFIQLVERPHMQKLYGRSLRQDAGLVRSIKRSLPPPLQKWQGSMDKVIGETFDFVEEFLDAARPKLANGVSHFMKDTTTLFQKYPARVTVTRLDPDIAGFDPADYSLEISGTHASPEVKTQHISDKEGESARQLPERTSEHKTLTFEYGAPIRVKWTAPAHHSKNDWVGLYMVTDNESREVTRVASQGRWIATNENVYDTLTATAGLKSSNIPVQATTSDTDLVSGEMVFSGDKLWWTQGVFEFRYHHNGKHNVLATSPPFEVRIGRFDEDDVDGVGLIGDGHDAVMRTAVEAELLPVVRRCFDSDPEMAPETVDEGFGALVERDGKFAKRVVFAVWHMFGIEFAPQVVQADGTVRNLAWRIVKAKKVLAPYSMSRSKGTGTPVGDKA